MSKKKVAFTAIVEAVNCVGGKKRSRKDSYFKMIDYKSVLRNKVILMILIKIYVIQIRVKKTKRWLEANRQYRSGVVVGRWRSKP